MFIPKIGKNLNSTENRIFSNQYGTWKVEDSKVNFNYNGTYQGRVISSILVKL